MKLNLSSGLAYFTNDAGQKVCMGSHMGRPDNIPDGVKTLPSVKVHLVKLDWVDGDYDEKGAYWGGGSGDFIYCAHAVTFNPVGDNPFPPCQIFVRGRSREDAKAAVREKLPNARFYR